MEGGSDQFRRFNISAADRAKSEARMWNDSRIRTQIMYVDDSEYDDRQNQQQCFVSFHAIHRLLTYVELHPTAASSAKSSMDGEERSQEGAQKISRMTEATEKA